MRKLKFKVGIGIHDNSESGLSMIIAMMSVLLLFTTVIGVTTLVITQGQITRAQRQSGRALNIAEAGINHALYEIKANTSPMTSSLFTSPTNLKSYRGGTYELSISQPAAVSFSDWYHVVSTGSISGEASRRIEIDAFKVSFWNMGYSGSAVDTLQGNAVINGALYVKSDLIMDRGGSGIKRGPLYVKGDIELDNAAAFVGESTLNVPLFLEGDYSGTGDYYVDPVNNWVPKLTLPEVDMEDLKQKAIDNNNSVYNGDLTLRAQNRNFGNFNYTAAAVRRGGPGAGGDPILDRTITTSGFGNLNLPVATASDADGNLYILERGANRVLKYSSTIDYEDSWGGLNSPNGIAADANNNIYVSDSGANVVKKYDSNGGLLAVIGGGTLNNPLGVATDSSGNVYVVDSGNSFVRKYDSNGTLQWSTAAITEPRGVAVDASGYVYVSCKTSITPARYGINKYNSSGTYVSQSGGSVSLGDPKNIAVDDARVFVAEKGNDRINRISTSSLSLTPPGFSTMSGYNDPEGVSLDGSNNLIVSDTANNAVKIYKQEQAGLTLDGVAFIDGDLTIAQDVIYSFPSDLNGDGSKNGTIAVNGDINITAIGQRYFRTPDVSGDTISGVDDPDEPDFTLIDAMGLITEGNVSMSGSGGGTYQKPELVALAYGKNNVTISGPLKLRGMFATNNLVLEQVPWIYLQKPENMPPFMPGSDPQVFIGGWKEPE